MSDRPDETPAALTGGTPAPGRPAPSPTPDPLAPPPAAKQGMSRGWKIAIGIGCGCLGLLLLVVGGCVACGVYMFSPGPATDADGLLDDDTIGVVGAVYPGKDAGVQSLFESLLTNLDRAAIDDPSGDLSQLIDRIRDATRQSGDVSPLAMYGPRDATFAIRHVSPDEPTVLGIVNFGMLGRVFGWMGNRSGTTGQAEHRGVRIHGDPGGWQAAFLSGSLLLAQSEDRIRDAIDRAKDDTPGSSKVEVAAIAARGRALAEEWDVYVVIDNRASSLRELVSWPEDPELTERVATERPFDRDTTRWVEAGFDIVDADRLEIRVALEASDPAAAERLAAIAQAVVAGERDRIAASDGGLWWTSDHVEVKETSVICTVSLSNLDRALLRFLRLDRAS